MWTFESCPVQPDHDAATLSGLDKLLIATLTLGLEGTLALMLLPIGGGM